MGYTKEVSSTLSALTTLDGALPQGAPTSPDLANHIAYALDARLSALAEKNGLSYTRYAGDLTFSGVGLKVARTRRLIEHVIRDVGFSPRDEKARFLDRSKRQAVTGIVVNERANWPRATRRWLRQEVYFLTRYGVDSHLERRGIDKTSYKDFIYGHVYAMKQVRSDEAEKLLELLDQVDWPY